MCLAIDFSPSDLILIDDLLRNQFRFRLLLSPRWLIVSNASPGTRVCKMKTNENWAASKKIIDGMLINFEMLWWKLASSCFHWLIWFVMMSCYYGSPSSDRNINCASFFTTDCDNQERAAEIKRKPFHSIFMQLQWNKKLTGRLVVS